MSTEKNLSWAVTF